jgi:hypothetical protein
MILILSLVVVMSMGFLGVTYAAWTEALLITGTVTTGTFDAVIIDGEVAMNLDNAEIADCTSAISNADHTMTVAVTNSYDGFTCHIPMQVKNPTATSSIPVNVSVPALTWVSPVGVAPAGVTVALDNCWTASELLTVNLSTVTEYGTCMVSVEVATGALEGGNYSFKYDFTATQFNK